MATQTDTLARTYATSLYELADEGGGRDMVMEIADELEQICELLRGDRQLRELFTSPIIDTGRRSEALTRIFGNRVSELVVRFLVILNRNGRLGHLDPIQAAYDQKVQEAFGRIEVDVITASEIDEAAKARIGERIKQALGKDPVMHSYTDPSIIGGVRLRIGDEMIDGSVATRLRRMGAALQQHGGNNIRSQMGRFLEDDA
ncbi:MAG: ATP synthase F1 subunit delta [Planctomycetota bacterium]|nr:ATP synthase F1 subunit delta [Planctomycetota bacterium]